MLYAVLWTTTNKAPKQMCCIYVFFFLQALNVRYMENSIFYTRAVAYSSLAYICFDCFYYYLNVHDYARARLSDRNFKMYARQTQCARQTHIICNLFIIIYILRWVRLIEIVIKKKIEIFLNIFQNCEEKMCPKESTQYHFTGGNNINNIRCGKIEFVQKFHISIHKWRRRAHLP